MLKVNGLFFFPALMFGALWGAYDLGFVSSGHEYRYLTGWWGCYASFIVMLVADKETKHPIIYKTWATVLFYAFFCTVFIH